MWGARRTDQTVEVSPARSHHSWLRSVPKCLPRCVCIAVVHQLFHSAVQHLHKLRPSSVQLTPRFCHRHHRIAVTAINHSTRAPPPLAVWLTDVDPRVSSTLRDSLDLVHDPRALFHPTPTDGLIPSRRSCVITSIRLPACPVRTADGLDTQPGPLRPNSSDCPRQHGYYLSRYLPSTLDGTWPRHTHLPPHFGLPICAASRLPPTDLRATHLQLRATPRLIWPTQHNLSRQTHCSPSYNCAQA